uniref:Uncharacterized protein n=1 Tax=Syphacia muris TaxID=451379 RepID=A0A0N5ARB2_9BILA
MNQNDKDDFFNAALRSHSRDPATNLIPNQQPATTKDGTTQITNEQRKKRHKKNKTQVKPQEPTPPPPPPEKTGGRTIWRNIIWQLILFVYSGIGGVAFSAIEGYKFIYCTTCLTAFCSNNKYNIYTITSLLTRNMKIFCKNLFEQYLSSAWQTLLTI